MRSEEMRGLEAPAPAGLTLVDARGGVSSSSSSSVAAPVTSTAGMRRKRADKGRGEEGVKRGRVVETAGKRQLLAWEELPLWQRQQGGNLIFTGYRKAPGTVRDCLASWFYLHNESVNIHSHTLGALLFLLLPFCIFSTSQIPPRYAAASPGEAAACGVYFAGVAVCFALSAAFHTFIPHGLAAFRLGLKLDVQGCLLLMWGSTAPLVYYSFPPPLCHHQSNGDGGAAAARRTAYYAATAALALACSAATFAPALAGARGAVPRALLLAAFGLASFVAPVVHGAALSPGGLAEQARRVGLRWVAVTAGCNVAALVVYISKVPERWYPCRFDIFGHSHQLMHILIVCSALAYAMAVVESFDARHSEGAADGFVVCPGWLDIDSTR
ncbi:hypothetical protein RB595_008533 [Gaeumannomyces hyphopodioides]